MTYTPPITDRAQLDITNKTAKAFFNVADWVRIYDNAEAVNAFVSFLNSVIPFDQITYPTTLTIPSVANLNILLANIERIRLTSNLPAIAGLNEVTSNWQSGSAANAPTYMDVNTWEQVLDVLLTTVNNSIQYRVSCGVASAGQARFYQHRFRQYQWVEDVVSPVRRHKLGIAVSGVGLTRNNRFRRYS
jgi:hypothetical protein